MGKKESFEISKAIGMLASLVNKEFGVEVAVPGNDASFSDIKYWVPTRSGLYNRLLGGGTPHGRMIEIWGDPSQGKSTLVTEMMIGFQRYPGISILLDAESGFHKQRALAMGHNPDRHIHLQADTVELGSRVIKEMIARMRHKDSQFPIDMPIGFFWDTISASQTEGEKEGDPFKDGIADKPRKVRAMCRAFSLLLPRNNCSVVFVSQTTMQINKGIPGPPSKKSASGGEAIKFWSSKRFKVRSTGKIDYPQPNSGILCKIENIKDKIDPPYRAINLPIMYKTGLDPLYEKIVFILDHAAKDDKMMEMSGGRLHLHNYPDKGNKKTFFMKQAKDFMEKNDGAEVLIDEYVNELWERVYG